MKFELWEPEKTEVWESKKKIAYRNLIVSSFTLLFAFVVWMLWSSLMVYISNTRPEFSTSDIYWLTALPLLSAAILRIPYSFIVPHVGGARWNAFSTGILAIPLLFTFYCFEYNLSKGYFFVASLLTGIAGANFASSCNNISYFFPYRWKSIALGINSSLGNLGVGVGQWLMPLVVVGAVEWGFASDFDTIENIRYSLSAAPKFLLWICLISTVASLFFMNNISLSRPSLASQLTILKDKQCWYMCLLYTFSFGAYIGLASIFPYVIAKFYGAKDATTFAFIGAALSALMRPMGHVIAKVIGAVLTTIISYLLLFLGAFGVYFALVNIDEYWSLNGFLLFYLILFLGTGLGKGSTTAMIPEIYYLRHKKSDLPEEKVNQLAAQDTGSVVGFTSAIATFGAFLLPLIVEIIRTLTNSETSAFIFFGICFVGCVGFTTIVYWRKVDSNPLYVKLKNGKELIVDSPDKMELTSGSL